MNKASILTITVLTLFLAACSDSSDSMSDSPSISQSTALTENFGSITSRNSEPDSTEEDRALLVSGYNDFSLDTYKALVGTAPAENAIMSGYSAAIALTLTMAGTAGGSRDALAALLNLDTISEATVDAVANAVDLALESRNNDRLLLRSANRLFLSEELVFRDTFLDNAVGNYGAPVTTADFLNNGPAVVDDINAWANEQTDGMIPELIDTIPSNTVFAILNAILLDAGWAEVFNDLGDQEFTALDGIASAIPFFGNQTSYLASVSDELTAIDIPYAGNELSMLLVMPNDLTAFEQSLSADQITQIVDGLSTQEAIVSIPEWTYEQTIILNGLLTPLGLPSGPMDFSAMLADGSITPSISIAALQKARIEVDKDGTRAAAVSAVIGLTSVPADPVAITFNRPFWYAIRDRVSGVLLFTGRVVTPTTGG